MTSEGIGMNSRVVPPRMMNGRNLLLLFSSIFYHGKG